MKTVNAVATAFGVANEVAEGILARAVEYKNKGKGLVLVDHRAADDLAHLFDQRSIWLSPELNEKIGWQFSQAVFFLRQRGYKIKTLSLGNRLFAYQLVSKPEEGNVSGETDND